MPELRQCLLFKLGGIHLPGRVGVEFHVNDRRREIFHRGETLVKGGSCSHFVDERLRHLFFGLVVQGVFIEDVPGEYPVLVNLAGKLHKVPGRRAEGRIGGVVGEGVKGMAEFVKERLRIVQTDEHRFSVAALGKVVVI